MPRRSLHSWNAGGCDRERQAYNVSSADPGWKTGDCRGLSHEACSRRQSTSTSEWSHAQEDGYNYEMVYAPEVSSTCPGEVGARDLGEWRLGDGALSAGPQGLAGPAGLGKQESLVGKGQAVKGLPCLHCREWGTGDGALRDTGKPKSPGINGAWPPYLTWPRLPLEARTQNPAYHSVGPGHNCGLSQ